MVTDSFGRGEYHAMKVRVQECQDGQEGIGQLVNSGPFPGRWFWWYRPAAGRPERRMPAYFALALSDQNRTPYRRDYRFQLGLEECRRLLREETVEAWPSPPWKHGPAPTADRTAVETKRYPPSKPLLSEGLGSPIKSSAGPMRISIEEMNELLAPLSLEEFAEHRDAEGFIIRESFRVGGTRQEQLVVPEPRWQRAVPFLDPRGKVGICLVAVPCGPAIGREGLALYLTRRYLTGMYASVCRLGEY